MDGFVFVSGVIGFPAASVVGAAVAVAAGIGFPDASVVAAVEEENMLPMLPMLPNIPDPVVVVGFPDASVVVVGFPDASLEEEEEENMLPMLPNNPDDEFPDASVVGFPDASVEEKILNGSLYENDENDENNALIGVVPFKNDDDVIIFKFIL